RPRPARFSTSTARRPARAVTTERGGDRARPVVLGNGLVRQRGGRRPNCCSGRVVPHQPALLPSGAGHVGGGSLDTRPAAGESHHRLPAPCRPVHLWPSTKPVSPPASSCRLRVRRSGAAPAPAWTGGRARSAVSTGCLSHGERALRRPAGGAWVAP